MGKTQSKRSVDITTEPKKGSDEEVTGKLEKIADIDQKQVNGDATPPENNDVQKRDSSGMENDKDLTTEKSADTAQPSGDNGDQENIVTTEAEIPKDNTAVTTTITTKKEGADAASEEISPLADDSSKKSKKEKVKKKWSFRSISFGKKDKQKPAKTEEVNESTAATNGTEKSAVEEGATETKDKEADENTEISKPVENGDASEKELNGQHTPTSNEEKSTEAAVISETSTASETPAIVPSTNNETAIENQTETKTAVTVSDETSGVSTTAAILSNGENAENNGIAADNEISTSKVECEKPADAVVLATAAESNEEKPHQNGTNVDESEADEQQIKSKIEVKTNTDNSPAEHLVPSHCTSSDPTTEIRESNNILDICKEDKPELDHIKNAINEKKDPEKIGNVAYINIDSGSESIEACMVSTQCNTQPPPLPSFPPPSQVSIFALNNENTENSTETSTKPAEVATSSRRDESEQTGIVSEETPKESISPPNTPIATDLSEMESQIPVKHAGDIGNEKIDDADDFNTKPELVMIKEETFVVVTREEPSNEEEQVFHVEITEELTVAKGVVSEIAEKAVQIVQQKEHELFQSQNQPQREVPELIENGTNVVIMNAENKMNKKLKENENNITEIITEVAPQASEIETSAQSDKLEIVSIPNLESDVPQNENKFEVCSLTETQIEVDSPNKDCTEAFSSDLVCSSKEIATAKDLKENAVAEVTTQDLPVTCE